jgi:3-isopropylmalate/(R)-2-methylmalate dehydratase large subunit
MPRKSGDRFSEKGMRKERTLFEKIWADHLIVASPQGEELLYVDFNLINEGQSFLAFDQLRMEGRIARRPQQHLAVTDHYLPTINRDRGPAGMPNREIRRVVEMMDENAKEFKLPHVGWSHRDQGIAHVISPELGISQPGMLITCNDSHTATNGACGALAEPVGGGNQLRHVVATQTVWLKRPGTMRISINGTLPEAVTAKDVILSIIQSIGVGGATGCAGRLTICNMSIEAGARIGMIAPDDTTYQFLIGRRHAPRARTGTRRWPIGQRCRPTPMHNSIASYRSMPRASHRW